MTDPLRRNGNLVESLGSSLRSGGHALGTAPALLRQILEAESWRDFVTQRGEHVVHLRFEDFVLTPPLHGLGASMRLVEKILDSIEDTADRLVTRDLLDRAVQRGHGGPRTKLDNIQLDPPPSGTSQTAALRRLRKDAPELHAEVLAGTLSAHAAMVKAGFRPKSFSVPAGRPEQLVAALRRNLDPADLAEVVKLLTLEGE